MTPSEFAHPDDVMDGLGGIAYRYFDPWNEVPSIVKHIQNVSSIRECLD